MARINNDNQEININFDPSVLIDPEEGYPRYNIRVSYGDTEDPETEYLNYFMPNEKNKLIDYINNNLQEELKIFDNITEIEIIWELDENYWETIDTIYEREN